MHPNSFDLTPAPPEKPCDASSRGSLLSSTEYTESSVRFCSTDACVNGVRRLGRIPYTNQTYRVQYYVCGSAGWELKCTTQTSYVSTCERGKNQSTCTDGAGNLTTFSPISLLGPTPTHTSQPDAGCRDVFERYKTQVQLERDAEQIAFEGLRARAAIARSAASQLSPRPREGLQPQSYRSGVVGSSP